MLSVRCTAADFGRGGGWNLAEGLALLPECNGVDECERYC